MPPVGAYVGVAALSAVTCYLLLFPVRRLAGRVGFVAEPDERRVHVRTTPLGGGVAMFGAFLVAMAFAALLPPLQGVFAGSSEPLGLVLGAAIVFAVGLVDDYRETSAPARVAAEVLAAMVLVFTGLTMFQFKIPFVGFLVLSPQVTPLLTALWVVVITNAVNLIDGLDGLAAGVVAIAAGALAVYGLRLMDLGILPTDNIGPLIAVIACGVCIGFLPHNVHVARAFMGDAGALFLGLLMAAATMVIGGRTPEYSGQSYFFFAPLFIPLFILGVPIADMAFAFIRRTARGTSFHTPDKDHLHHRLLRLGHGPRRTVFILWAWTAILSGLVLYPLFGGAGNGQIPFAFGAAALLLYTLLRPGLRKSGHEQAPATVAPGGPAGSADPVPLTDPAAPAGSIGPAGSVAPAGSVVPAGAVVPAGSVGPAAPVDPVERASSVPTGPVPVAVALGRRPARRHRPSPVPTRQPLGGATLAPRPAVGNRRLPPAAARGRRVVARYRDPEWTPTAGGPLPRGGNGGDGAG